jgi:hypothetical protein
MPLITRSYVLPRIKILIIGRIYMELEIYTRSLEATTYLLFLIY